MKRKRLAFALALTTAVWSGLPSLPSSAAEEGGGPASRGAAKPDPATIAEGRSLFNQNCSHCHSPNAASPDPPRDLRRLSLRYGDHMREVFWYTVTHGRPDKGMPNWSGVLDEKTLWTIFSFLESIQTKP
ncbi:MAG: cytochrome c [Acidobacteriia bacterium]|nr:c-type cytochrome [Methyloceanibacter sp.]MBX5471817.1 c-type cytochrome [Acetobacteraceae bacterium]MCL6491841.1 cytochrome c [Terriglobia bacterium]